MGGVKKPSAPAARAGSGVFPSPGTPNYRNAPAAGAYPKGWSSERVPLRYIGGRLKALPSKWEDAEKWICSPVDGGRVAAAPAAHYRRPKSKSGPLGPVVRPYVGVSPMVNCFDNGRIGGFAVGSPFLAGIIAQDRSYSSAGSGVGGDGGRRSCSANTEPFLVRSTSVHGWLDAMMEFSPSLPSSQGTEQDEKLDSCTESAIEVSPVVLRRDMATQMSPEGSTQSSPKDRPLSPPSPSAQTIEELENSFSKMEVRDVQVDERVVVTRRSKKQVALGSDKSSPSLMKWKKKTVEANSCAWDVGNMRNSYKSEEGKITAWEKLQTAKAEAAMRKLEMKLEKKRSSSMDRILNKLRSAQREAQEMRNAATTSQPHEVATPTKKFPYFRRTSHLSSLSGCFTCHAF